MLRIGKRRRLIARCCCARPITHRANRPRSRDSPIAPGDVNFTIKAGQNVKTISQWIYGMNGTSLNSALTSYRLGGNRWTAYNWETNASNAGKDYKYENDNYLGSSSTPSAAISPTLHGRRLRQARLSSRCRWLAMSRGDEAGPVPLADVATVARFKQVVAKKPPHVCRSRIPTRTDGVCL